MERCTRQPPTTRRHGRPLTCGRLSARERAAVRLDAPPSLPSSTSRKSGVARSAASASRVALVRPARRAAAMGCQETVREASGECRGMRGWPEEPAIPRRGAAAGEAHTEFGSKVAIVANFALSSIHHGRSCSRAGARRPGSPALCGGALGGRPGPRRRPARGLHRTTKQPGGARRQGRRRGGAVGAAGGRRCGSTPAARLRACCCCLSSACLALSSPSAAQHTQAGPRATAQQQPSLTLTCTHAGASARLEGVNKPELLPKGEVTPVIDVAGFLTDGEVGAGKGMGRGRAVPCAACRHVAASPSRPSRRAPRLLALARSGASATAWRRWSRTWA
jgi:hypothetical protein